MPVGTSLRRWSHGLTELSPSAELEYWREVVDFDGAPIGSRPLDAERDRGSSLRRVRVDIDRDTTDHLLRAVPSHYRTGVNDGLLSALALALRTWSGSQRMLVSLESHGRDEDVLPGADLSRTVGWFTAVYPVRIDLTGLGVDTPTVVKSVKEQLRTTPGSGIGYGLLRRAGMLTGPEPQIGFNYLGKMSTAEFGDELPGRGLDSRRRNRSQQRQRKRSRGQLRDRHQCRRRGRSGRRVPFGVICFPRRYLRTRCSRGARDGVARRTGEDCRLRR